MNITQGPWIVSTSNTMNEPHSMIIVKSVNTNYTVAVTGAEGTKTQAQALANAALISIAPDMLEALIAIQEFANMKSTIDSEAVDNLISEIFEKLANEAGA